MGLYLKMFYDIFIVLFPCTFYSCYLFVLQLWFASFQTILTLLWPSHLSLCAQCKCYFLQESYPGLKPSQILFWRTIYYVLNKGCQLGVTVWGGKHIRILNVILKGCHNIFWNKGEKAINIDLEIWKRNNLFKRIEGNLSCSPPRDSPGAALFV